MPAGADAAEVKFVVEGTPSSRTVLAAAVTGATAPAVHLASRLRPRLPIHAKPRTKVTAAKAVTQPKKPPHHIVRRVERRRVYRSYAVRGAPFNTFGSSSGRPF